jgi:hypothetical protein
LFRGDGWFAAAQPIIEVAVGAPLLNLFGRHFLEFDQFGVAFGLMGEP